MPNTTPSNPDQDRHFHEGEFYIPISKIDIDYKDRKGRARKNVPQTRFQALKHDIQENGLLNAIVVAESNTEGRYVLIAGFCRLQAHKELGYKEIRAKLRKDLDEVELRELELIENMLRIDLTLEETVNAYGELFELRKRLFEESISVITPFNRYTQTDFAEDVGKSEGHVGSYIRLYAAQEKYPGLLENATSLNAALRELRRYEAQLPIQEDSYRQKLRDGLKVGVWHRALETFTPGSLQALILEAEETYMPPEKWFPYLHPKGYALYFCRVPDFPRLLSDMQHTSGKIEPEPYILSTKASETECHFYFLIQGSLNLKPPTMRRVISATYETSPVHPYTKPHDFYLTLLKPLDKNAIFGSPCTYSIALTRACIDKELVYNVFCPSENLKNQMLMNLDIRS